MTDRPRSVAWRLAAFYAAFFALIGIQQPFWPVWLSAKGLSAPQIGIALALSIGVKLISAPLVAHWADRTGERRRPMRILALGACGAFALFALTEGFWPIAAVSVLFFALWPPMMSLAESMTTAAARDGTVHYGRIRLWGSLSFIVFAFLTGRLLLALPVDAVFWLSLATVGLTLATCATLPDMRADRRHAARWPILDVLDDRRFCLLIAACGLLQSSHAVYYAFATLHWRAAGYSSAVIGALWGEAVIAEILLFAVGTSVAARLGAAPLLLLSAAAAIVRWIGTATSDALPALVALQALHAFSFGAAHIAAMHWIGHAVTPSLAATAQSLYSGMVWGLFLGVMLFAAGLLYASLGQQAFLAMAGVALAGGVAAFLLLRHG